MAVTGKSVAQGRGSQVRIQMVKKEGKGKCGMERREKTDGSEESVKALRSDSIHDYPGGWFTTPQPSRGAMAASRFKQTQYNHIENRAVAYHITLEINDGDD
jgi:hypothetical protein